MRLNEVLRIFLTTMTVGLAKTIWKQDVKTQLSTKIWCVRGSSDEIWISNQKSSSHATTTPLRLHHHHRTFRYSKTSAHSWSRLAYIRPLLILAVVVLRKQRKVGRFDTLVLWNIIGYWLCFCRRQHQFSEDEMPLLSFTFTGTRVLCPLQFCSAHSYGVEKLLLRKLLFL